MPDYQNGKIYQITNTTNGECLYIGSTIQALTSRIAEHKNAYSKGINLPLYRYIETIPSEWADIKIGLLKQAPTSTLEQLRREEGECSTH